MADFFFLKGLWQLSKSVSPTPDPTIPLTPCYFSCVLRGCRLCGYHLSTTAGCLPESLSLPPAFKFVLLWSDWWQVSQHRPCKISNSSTGKLLIPSQVYFNFSTWQRAKFMHYAGTQTQNCDELHHPLNRVWGGDLYINLGYFIVCFFLSLGLSRGV